MPDEGDLESSRPNLVLFGFMGSGKSTLGRRIAGQFQLPFLDSDEEIRRRSGLSPCEWIRSYGEPKFRAQEKKTIRELSKLRGHVLATGGGVPLDPENVEVLAKSGVLVCLTASEASLRRRLERDTSRPLFDAETFPQLLRARQEAYARIPWRVATDGREVEDLAREIYQSYLQRSRSFEAS